MNLDGKYESDKEERIAWAIKAAEVVMKANQDELRIEPDDDFATWIGARAKTPKLKGIPVPKRTKPTIPLPAKKDAAYEAYINEQEAELIHLSQLVDEYTCNMNEQDETIERLEKKIKAKDMASDLRAKGIAKLADGYQLQAAQWKKANIELAAKVKALETKLAMITQLSITRHTPKIDTGTL